MSKWYRVIDPLSPMFGCDVLLSENKVWNVGWAPDTEFHEVIALRRVDIFVGDRPFQLTAPAGESLGMLIDGEQLELSVIQSDVMEAGVDRPFGLCIDESMLTRSDGLTLRVARYERAMQVALDDIEGRLLASKTFSGLPGEGTSEESIVAMFERGDDADEIAFFLTRRD